MGTFRRVCGEKRKDFETANRKKGSPPRVRGKAEVRHERDQEPGITPACAGKRHCPRFRPGKTRDHPRVCGEKSSLMQMDVGPLGSPPRMRGKGCYMQELSGETGITPAYAGKRQRRATACTWLRDHPRVCGEKAYSLVINGSEWGSPPRMRGKGTKRCSSRRGGRITPAYAGKSKRTAPSSVLFGDHPRVCGEKLRESRGLNRTRGSPPRMRGKVFDADYSILRSGITPAYAGKSYTRTCYAYNVRDHPRVCGEKYVP